ncbi:phosphodiester glycosidase family protein [Pseudobacillus sp. 179-B 2D1 NHS]|uniref:phosphodiester glycosidase family protein n=1 Tax=Pseudobacillus sp. 179-B 2D1 NHS TaxID=3374292 RepID=UPI00387A4796
MRKKKTGLLLFLLVLLLAFPMESLAKTTALSNGVNWRHVYTKVNGKYQSINIMAADLTKRGHSISYHLPMPYYRLNKVSALSNRQMPTGQRQLGAINASFFHFSTREPAYLLVKENKLDNLGAVSNKNTDYMYVPAAFGVKKDGAAMIDRFRLSMTANSKKAAFPITGYNESREQEELILYTRSMKFNNTRTNPYGYEVTVEGLDHPLDPGAKFGEPVTGKVTAIRKYGERSSSVIPKNGFVLSAHGEKTQLLKSLKTGDPVSLTINPEEKWKDSRFMLASGPLLVQKGKVAMTMSTKSPNARARAPRSAIMVDRSGKKVYFVTVDGRQKRSAGMTLMEFAGYLKSLGGYQALNLDGGGSTTMAGRAIGSSKAKVLNIPSDGRERTVSAILEIFQAK